MKPWLKLWHQYLDDPKIQRVAPALRAWHINLLCVACKEDANGKLPGIEKMVFLMRLSSDEIQGILNSLVESGLIELRVNSYWIHDWDDWQERKSPAAIRQKRVRDKRNALRNGHSDALRNSSVTSGATFARALTLNSDSGIGGMQGGEGVTQNPPDEVANLAAATEARWPDQNAGVTVRDLCREFDFRLVGDILNQAYDKDPDELPKTWIRRGCQNQVNRGWTPKDAKAPARPKTSAEIDAEVDALEAKYNAQREAERVERERSAKKP